MREILAQHGPELDPKGNECDCSGSYRKNRRLFLPSAGSRQHSGDRNGGDTISTLASGSFDRHRGTGLRDDGGSWLGDNRGTGFGSH